MKTKKKKPSSKNLKDQLDIDDESDEEKKPESNNEDEEKKPSSKNLQDQLDEEDVSDEEKKLENNTEDTDGENGLGWIFEENFEEQPKKKRKF